MYVQQKQKATINGMADDTRYLNKVDPEIVHPLSKSRAKGCVLG